MAAPSFVLEYLPLQITLYSIENAKLPPFLGSTLRGAIGQALLKDKLLYDFLFNNKSLSHGKKDIPNPYLLDLPDTNQFEFKPEEELTFKILLFGEAFEYTQAIVNALKEKELGLGAARYPFKLKQVKHEIDQRIIWKDGNYYEEAVCSFLLPYRTLSNVTRVILRTLTPLRIRRNGQLLTDIDFVTVIRNITNRLATLTSRYGGWVDEVEVQRIQNLAYQVEIVHSNFALVDLARYSNRLGEKMDFSGLMGSIEVQGDLTPFVPWLFAAQTLHLGRNTTFGMGKIEVEFI
ncbi:MAG: CRISPR system precrRNA processing endoribonuclease RAMP protein Cas6 [Peptococcaceae bacterium]|nr:CRISPR system precrRNA processing endoribonuclease RAMP protein Cas6 [Peptococcaceae bacterium]